MAKVSTFTVIIAGAKYYQEAISRGYDGQPVKLIRDPNNKHDKNAIEVRGSLWKLIGHIPRDQAIGMASSIDYGDKVKARIEKHLEPTKEFPWIGVMLRITLTPASLL